MSDLPLGWAKSVLGDLAIYVTSGSRDWSKYYSTVGSLFVRTENINTNRLGSIDDIARVALPESVEGKRTLIRRDDLLITITGANVGKCAHVDREIPEAYVSQSVALVRLVDSSLARFVHKQLIAPGPDGERTLLQESAYGLGRPVLNLDNVREIALKLAPLPEQKRIADKLDALLARVDACRERLDRVPTLLKRFRQSVLAAATSGELTREWRGGADVDWTYERAAAVCNKVQSGGTPKEGFSTSGIPFLKVYNIVNQQIKFEYKPQFISPEIHAGSMRKSQAVPGDVLMNIVGPPLGKVAIVPDNHPNWNINQAITLFRPSARVSSGWLYYVLCSGRNIENIEHETRGSAGQTNISLSQCRDFVLPIPDPTEQAEIVRRVGELFVLAARVEHRLEFAQTLVAQSTPSSLAKAFRGELVPQDPDDEPAADLLAKLKAQRSATAAELPRKRPKVPGKRPTMSNTDKETIKAAILKLKVDRFSFDDLRAQVAGDYDSLKDALFELLEEPQPVVRQVFDKKAKTMQLVRVRP